MPYVFLICFWIIQIFCAIFFAYSSQPGRSFWLYFSMAHVIGVPSLWFVVQLCKCWNPNVSFGVAYGGMVLATQLGLALWFQTRISMLQWLGVALIVSGILILGLGKQDEAVTKTLANDRRPEPQAAVLPVDLKPDAR